MKSTRGLVVFIDMNTYIITKGRDFKTLCNRFAQFLLISEKHVERGIEHVILISAYGVCIH